ncbi:hypothetical protein MOD78_09785 [Bacillus haynesii]|nr:hypothetical protein [Bacillus haynesii]MCY8625902.1 hypothetical protein [Bacillus haynesii]
MGRKDKVIYFKIMFKGAGKRSGIHFIPHGRRLFQLFNQKATSITALRDA